MTYLSPRAVTSPLRGLYKEGTWHCNCPGRPPAILRQVKKEGPNTGRYFWTCQHGEGRKCNFFLWKEAAEARAKATSASDSDARVGKSTPTKLEISEQGGLLTPETQRAAGPEMISYSAEDFSDDDFDETEEYLNKKQRESQSSQPSSFRRFEAMESPSYLDPSLSSPSRSYSGSRAIARSETRTSPRKRLFSETDIVKEGQVLAWSAEHSSSQPFNTQLTSTEKSSMSSRTSRGSGHRLMTPSSQRSVRLSTSNAHDLPTPTNYGDLLPDPDSREDMSELANQAFAVVGSVVLPRDVRNSLVTLLNQQELRTKGIERGRDISRMALEKKKEEIKKLKAIISSLMETEA